MELKALDKAGIFGCDDLKVEAVAVPEWGGTVHVRGMRGFERDAFEQSMFTGEGESRTFVGDNIRARLLVRTLCNENGERLFDDSDDADLGRRNAAAISRLYLVAQRLSGLGDEEVKKAGNA